MKIRLGQIDLARGLAHRESPRRFSLTTQRETQVAEGVRAPTAEIFDRGNARTQVTFTIAKRHDSPEHALRFAALHALALANASGGLILVSEDSTTEAELYLPDAVLHSLRCVPTGAVTDTDYEFLGSVITTQPPGA